jgi:TonB-dependent receptor
MYKTTSHPLSLIPLSLTIILLLIQTNTSYSATEGKIQGVVKDSISKKPLTGVNIYIMGTAIGAASDLDGRYLINRVPPGRQKVVFTYMGYRDDSVEVQLQPEQEVQLDVSMVYKVLEGEVIEVTAQLEGQAAAINRQLTATSIVNVVSAERIQELPDANAAESVGRLPGISIIREGGEGQRIVIRGLAPTYNSVTYGGNKIPSGDLSDRSVDLSMISPEMLGGIEVLKAVTPDRDADAIGGIVDLQVAKAREGGLKSYLRVQSGYNSLQEEFGQYRFNFRLSQRFFNEELGILVSGNLERTNRSADVFDASYSLERESRPGEEYAPIKIGTLTLEDRVETLRRFGGNLMIDYRFDRGSVQFNTFLSFVERERTSQEQEMDPEVNNDHSFNLDVRDITKKIFTGSVSGEYQLPFLNIDAGLSFNQSMRVHPHDMSIQFTENAGFDQILYNEYKSTLGADAILKAAKNNIADAGINEGEVNKRRSDEKDLAAQVNLEFPYNFFDNYVSIALKTGAKYLGKERTTNELEFFARLYQENEYWNDYRRVHSLYGTPGFVWHTLSYSNMPSLMNYIDPGYDPGDFLDGDYDFVGALDREEILHLTKNFLIDSVYVQDNLSGMDDYEATENVSAGYIMAEINIGPRLLILPGVRYEHTFVKYVSISTSLTEEDIERRGSVKDTTASHQYENWFPMFHIRYRLTDWFDIRLAWTKTIARPRLDWINPKETKRTASERIRRGIIDLKPQISTNYDLFLTFHTYKLGLFTLGGFYKNIYDLIWLRRDIRILRSDIEAGKFPEEYLGNNLTQPENNPFETEVYGYEIEWQTNFSWLPSPFDGIVLYANYSHIWSETRYPYSKTVSLRVPPFTTTRTDTSRVGPMPNQSEHIANVALGYEKGGFSARLSALFQGRTLRSVGTRKEVDGYTDDLTRWDFMAKQKLTKWMSIYFNWNNISNSADYSYIQAVRFADEREFYGWTADIGLMFVF